MRKRISITLNRRDRMATETERIILSDYVSKGEIVLEIFTTRSRLYKRITIDLIDFDMDFRLGSLADFREIFQRYHPWRKKPRSRYRYFCALSRSYVSSPYIGSTVFRNFYWEIMRIILDPCTYCSHNYQKKLVGIYGKHLGRLEARDWEVGLDE
jgi:hypothetical protein